MGDSASFDLASLQARAEALLAAGDLDGLSALDDEVRDVLGLSNDTGRPSKAVGSKAILTREDLVALQSLYSLIADKVSSVRDTAGQKASGMQVNKKGIKAYQSL